MTLIDRLSKLEGPDREVDARIWCEVNGVVYLDHYPLMHETQVFYKEKGRRKEQVSGDDIPHAALYTASVDAAIALAERLFPGTEYEFTNLYNIVRVTIELNGEFGGFHGEHVNSLPIAICIAILRAKEAGHAE